jgi:hypothetical protein
MSMVQQVTQRDCLNSFLAFCRFLGEVARNSSFGSMNRNQNRLEQEEPKRFLKELFEHNLRCQDGVMSSGYSLLLQSSQISGYAPEEPELYFLHFVYAALPNPVCR